MWAGKTWKGRLVRIMENQDSERATSCADFPERYFREQRGTGESSSADVTGADIAANTGDAAGHEPGHGASAGEPGGAKFEEELLGQLRRLLEKIGSERCFLELKPSFLKAPALVRVQGRKAVLSFAFYGNGSIWVRLEGGPPHIMSWILQSLEKEGLYKAMSAEDKRCRTGDSSVEGPAAAPWQKIYPAGPALHHHDRARFWETLPEILLLFLNRNL